MKWNNFKDELPKEGQEIVVCEIHCGGTPAFTTGKFDNADYSNYSKNWHINVSDVLRRFIRCCDEILVSEVLLNDEDWVVKWAALTDYED